MNNLKKKIKSGELLVGGWITLYHPAIAEIFANANFDWIAVDLEHSVITMREAEELIRIIELKGISPLVRLSSIDEVQIKRVMDAGAHGVIIPMVKNANDIDDINRYILYPPRGNRGVGLARALVIFEPELKPTLKKENLTTRDSRVVERKKYGRRKARRSFQFSKR